MALRSTLSLLLSIICGLSFSPDRTSAATYSYLISDFDGTTDPITLPNSDVVTSKFYLDPSDGIADVLRYDTTTETASLSFSGFFVAELNGVPAFAPEPFVLSESGPYVYDAVNDRLVLTLNGGTVTPTPNLGYQIFTFINILDPGPPLPDPDPRKPPPILASWAVPSPNLAIDIPAGDTIFPDGALIETGASGTYTFSVVPTPASALLMMTGLSFLGGVCSYRRKRSKTCTS